MTEWRSPRELLNLNLPGFPKTRTRIRDRIEREGWPCRTVTGRGGERREYLVPDEILAKQPEPAISEAVSASAPMKAYFDAALADCFRRSEKVQKQGLDDATAFKAWLGLIERPEGLELPSERTLERFKRLIKEAHAEGDPAIWPALLVDGRVGRPRPRAYSSRVDDLIRADQLRSEEPSFKSSYDRIRPIALSEGLHVPSWKTLLYRMRTDMSWQAITLARKGKKAFEATYPAQERDRSVFRALEALNGDGWRADNLVVWLDGYIGRPVLYFVQDLYSGAILGWRVDRTENSQLMRLTIGDVVRNFGIPDLYYQDNSRAAASKGISGGTPNRFRYKIRAEDPEGLLSLLGVRLHWTIPGHGQSKPIEPAQGQVGNRISRHPRLAGSYTGANTVDRPEVRAPKPALLKDFIEVVAAEVKAHNERPGRRAKNCAGRSLWETFRESYERVPVRKATEEQLALALMAVEGVKVSSRDGTFRLAGDNRYYSEPVAQFAGRTICVRFDPEHLKSQVYCYQISGELIGAAECIAAVGFNDTNAAREHARLKRQNLRAHQTILANERRMGTRELVELLPHETPASELIKSKVVRLTPRLSIAAPATTVSINGDRQSDDDEHWKYYQSLKARAPETLDADELAAIRIYEAKAEYRIRTREREILGDQ